MIEPRGPIRTKQGAAWVDLILPKVLVLLAILFTGLFFGLATVSDRVNTAIFYCNPDGKVEFPWTHSIGCAPNAKSCTIGQAYEIGSRTKPYFPLWNPKLFLSITLGMGDLSFSAAKGLDIIWDLVVGRGGQILLGIYVYRLMRRSLTLTMERQSIGIPLFADLASGSFQLFSMFTLGQEVTRSGATDSSPKDDGRKRRLVGLAFAVVYVAVFGTFVSVMTG
jgi:hypothetical protein